jgi:hypothetical protein
MTSRRANDSAATANWRRCCSSDGVSCDWVAAVIRLLATVACHRHHQHRGVGRAQSSTVTICPVSRGLELHADRQRVTGSGVGQSR